MSEGDIEGRPEPPVGSPAPIPPNFEKVSKIKPAM